MNEEIDVSKCAFYSNGKCSNPNGMACNCRNTAICYFKELKRLEQENAKLKEDVKEAQEAYNFNRILYRADNMKLRKVLEGIKEVFKKYDSKEEGTVAELLHDVFEVYGRVCEVLKDE